MIAALKKLHPPTFIIILLLSFFLLFSSRETVLADTVSYLPITIWGTTLYTLPFSACMLYRGYGWNDHYCWWIQNTYLLQ